MSEDEGKVNWPITSDDPDYEPEPQELDYDAYYESLRERAKEPGKILGLKPGQLRISEKKMVFICSPLHGYYTQNLANAKRYARYATLKGYAVFVPHLLYTQFLNEESEAERKLGIESGIEFLHVCDELWAFARDYESCSDGMKKEIDEAKTNPFIKIVFIDPATIDIK